MARKTSLKLLEERAVLEPDAPDGRNVIEAFPPNPMPVQDSQLADNILEILRNSHDRIAGEARQATAVATAAIEKVDSVAGVVEKTEGVVKAVAAKIEQVEKDSAIAGQAVLSQVSNLLSTDRVQARQAAAAGVAIGLGSLGEKLAHGIVFLIDRAPALLALAAAVWLWHGILVDPRPLQLVALGLFGACVIAPAIWLGRCRKPDA